MITKKEIASFVIILVLFAFLLSFINKGSSSFIISEKAFLGGLVIAAIILGLNLLAKKLVAYYYECEIEQGIWFFQRYGIYERSYFKDKIPIGLLLPIAVVFFTLGAVKMLVMTQFEISAARQRAAKRHGLYRFSELTEFHIGVVAASGIAILLVSAVLAYIFGFGEYAKYAIYFSVWNMIPFSNLDGTKLFFGSRILYILLGVITLIFLFYALFLV